jgi:hypothetical protein
MNRKQKRLILIFSSLLIVSLFLIACGSTSNEAPETITETSQENQVMLPAVEVNTDENATPTADTYPDPEEKAKDTSYPVPEEAEMDSYPASEATEQEDEDTPDEANPTPDETSPIPTSRGNNLAATNPATVKLASGHLQLVEMFAYW